MLRSEIYGRTLRYFFAPVADYLYDNENVTEVLINGPDQIYVEMDGVPGLTKIDRRFDDENLLMSAVRNLAEYVNRRIDDRHHSMDARLPEPEKFRVHVIIPPVSRIGVCVSIRKFRRNNTSLEWLQERKSITPAAAEYLTLLVRYHHNIMVAGGTGSGKTSLLNALSIAIPERERIVVIEDSSELQLQQSHTVYLEARPADPHGHGAVTIRDLFIDSLRMRPDRILVGEVRRGEALDLIQSMLSGHDGSLSTVHAGTAMLALVRLETLCLMNETNLPVYVARTQVASAIQIVVVVSRFPDGTRRIREIGEVLGLDAKEKYRMRRIFEFQSEGRTADGRILGQLMPTGRVSKFRREMLQKAGADEMRLTREIWMGK